MATIGWPDWIDSPAGFGSAPSVLSFEFDERQVAWICDLSDLLLR